MTHTLHLAEIAMGCPRAALAEYRFQTRHGWSLTDPAQIIALATRNPHVKSLIWC